MGGGGGVKLTGLRGKDRAAGSCKARSENLNFVLRTICKTKEKHLLRTWLAINHNTSITSGE